MSTVATISIKLDAQTAAIKKGFAEVRNEGRGLSTQLRQSLGNGILKINAALSTMRMAFDAVRAAIRDVMQTVDRVADLGDFADRIQISVERLQELRIVTEQFGGNANVLNTALQRMQRRIADAAASGGPLADRLERVGLSAEHLAELSPDEQFLQMADAVRSLGTAGEQTALVMALMDTEGVALTNTLRQGTDALRDQMAAMGEHRTLTEAEVIEAQNLSAEMKLLNEEWETATTRLKISFVPALRELVTVLAEIAKFFSEHRADMQALFGVGGGGEMQVLEGFEERQRALEETRAANLRALGDVMRAMKTHRKELTETKRTLREFGDPLNIPGVGAVTSTSTAGFSALQDARRRAQQRARWESEMLATIRAWRDESRAARRETVPVSIL